jgi:hypothetical protein
MHRFHHSCRLLRMFPTPLQCRNCRLLSKSPPPQCAKGRG